MESEKRLKTGDLIEIFRGGYQHWVIYVGDGYVIHLAPPSEHAEAGVYSSMSVLCDKAIVKKDELYEVVGNDEYRINNLLDDEYEPRPIQHILRDANKYLGRVVSYSVFSRNCEHFVTELRYGKPQSRQVRETVETAVVAGITFGILAYAVSSIFSSKDKEKQSK